MSTISRRTALAGGSAAIAAAATLPVAALAQNPHDDSELFRAIARWRKVRDVYEAERKRQIAICARADAEMPECNALMNAYIAALEAAPQGERSREQRQRVDSTEAAWRPIRKTHYRRAKELGYDEDVTDRILSACTDACEEAFAIPAHTLAGLSAKMEMRVVEWPSETFYDDDGVDVLVADIQRLAGRAVS